MMTLAQAQALLPGARVVGDPGIAFERVHSDTRTLRAGDLFVALRGERFDGHAFLDAALAAGARALLAERGLAAERPGLEVADSLHALQQLAAGWRARFALPLAAITGSNGKTTVTQMVAAIGGAWLGAAMLATAGNLNNHIGVPLTLLRLRATHRAAVLELGTNHAGEIAELARLAQPTVALINNAQREHQEFLPGLDAVARENGSVIDALGPAGTVVLPAQDAFAPLWRAQAGTRRVLSFALDAAADVRVAAHWDGARNAFALELATPAGRIETALAQPGLHNALNAAAASACALALGAPAAAVAAGLAAFAPVGGRSRALQLVRAGQPVTLVDDSYNANPDSVRAAIDVLAGLPGPHWLVLGDMGEVGAQGPQFTSEVGAYARERGIESVWGAGPLSSGLGADRQFANAGALVTALARGEAAPPPAASVLVKGSRFMQMEQVVRVLEKEWAHAA